MKNTIKVFGVIALAAAIGRHGWRCKNALAGVFVKQKLPALLLAGMLIAIAACSNSSNSGGGGGHDSRLVLEDSYAWVRNAGSGGDEYGFIFKTDGTYDWIHKMYPYGDTDWVILNSGTWSTSGNNSITLTDSTGSHTVSYTMTDTTFTYIANNTTFTYTKTAVTMQ